jgi:cytoskeletal protein RodZ
LIQLSSALQSKTKKRSVMKKYMVIAVAALLFGGIANAQNPQPTKKAPATKTATTKATPGTSSTASVSPKTGKTAAATEGIKRKHHAHKKAAKATPAK